jgi:alginate O-acetyltransferase complex protein AlgI
VLFTEPIFLFLFLPLLLSLHFLPGLAAGGAPGHTHARYANWLLLVGSLVFYAHGGGTFTWLVLASIAFNYQMAILVASARTPVRARRRLMVAVGVDLAVLAVFKYANFIADNANALAAQVQLGPFPVPRVLLPIGISFFTFHAISYVVDVYRGDASAQKSPVHASLYLLLFPQLIAGPIIRYREIADQLGRRAVTLDDFAVGIRRFVFGLGKKVLVANTVAVPADQIFAMPPAQLSAGHAWLGIVCYTLQIYFDFSGYSDMAVGLGRMFGFRFPENFRWPYAADTVQEFWRRWHMSLSAWFRDYLYVPLGGNRVATPRIYLNLVVVFFLCGLWHGAAWSFVVWGFFHGAFLVVERVGLASLVRRLWRPLRHAYLLLVVMVGWVLFRADTLAGALAYLRAMAGLGLVAPTPYLVGWYLTPELWIALAAGVVGSMPVGPTLTAIRVRATRAAASYGTSDSGTASAAKIAGPVFALGGVLSIAFVLFASIVQIAGRTYNPFIYFRF